MAAFYQPHEKNREDEYLFIDGGNLDSIANSFSKRYFNGNPIDLDYHKIGQKQHCRFKKVFYYHCLPLKKEGESDEDYKNKIKPQIRKLNQINSLNGYHVRTGTVRRGRKKQPIQKKVDTLITVDMLTYAFNKNIKKATLLTSDLDFSPLIDKVVEQGMYVDLWYQLGRTNEELIYAADSQKPLMLQDIYGWATETFKQQYPLPNKELINQFSTWVKQDGKGKSFHSLTTGFILYNSEQKEDREYAPDISWLKLDKWEALTPQQKEKLIPLCPDFVIELCPLIKEEEKKRDKDLEKKEMKKFDQKMKMYIKNGAQLGWLIDPNSRCVYIYPPNREVQQLDNPVTVKGDESVLPGFTLVMDKIW